MSSREDSRLEYGRQSIAIEVGDADKLVRIADKLRCASFAFGEHESFRYPPHRPGDGRDFELCRG